MIIIMTGRSRGGVVINTKYIKFLGTYVSLIGLVLSGGHLQTNP